MANIIRTGGGGGSATLITKSITQNGTYNASSDSADGYSEVDVNVPSGSQLNLLYSLNQSQGGAWVNTDITASDYDKFVFVSSESGDEKYTVSIATADIAVYTGGTDVYTTILSASQIGRDFNVRIYNNKLYISFGGTGASTKVVSVYNEISGGGGASFDEVLSAGVISTDSWYATANFNDVSNYDYLYIRIYQSTPSNWCYVVPVSDIPTTGSTTIILSTEDTGRAITCQLSRTSLGSTYYSGSYNYIYADIVGSNAEPFS